MKDLELIIQEDKLIPMDEPEIRLQLLNLSLNTMGNYEYYDSFIDYTNRIKEIGYHINYYWNETNQEPFIEYKLKEVGFILK